MEPRDGRSGMTARQQPQYARRRARKETPVQLLVPSLAHLEPYADALRRGWSPDNVRLEEAAREELEPIADDPAAFSAMPDDRDPKRRPTPPPDAPQVPYP